jgi:hypothetical protein
MTKRDRNALARYIRWVADAIELRDWTITLDDEPCDPDYNARVDCSEGRKHATIAFHAKFREMDPEDQRQTIVHELVHAHHAVTWRMVQTDLLRPLGQETYGVFVDSYRRAMEYCVDATADALVKHLPLIRWPKA